MAFHVISWKEEKHYIRSSLLLIPFNRCRGGVKKGTWGERAGGVSDFTNAVGFHEISMRIRIELWSRRLRFGGLSSKAIKIAPQSVFLLYGYEVGPRRPEYKAAWKFQEPIQR